MGNEFLSEHWIETRACDCCFCLSALPNPKSLYAVARLYTRLCCPSLPVSPAVPVNGLKAIATSTPVFPPPSIRRSVSFRVRTIPSRLSINTLGVPGRLFCPGPELCASFRELCATRARHRRWVECSYVSHSVYRMSSITAWKRSTVVFSLLLLPSADSSVRVARRLKSIIHVTHSDQGECKSVRFANRTQSSGS